jgi:hypothetical protein
MATARNIDVVRKPGDDPLAFDVTIREGKSESRHRVTMAQATCTKLTGGDHTPEQCIDAAFRFLLDREPKEAILGRFDVSVISRYFPEFERELPDYLRAAR